MNLTLISSAGWSTFFRRSILWIAIILISLYGQRILIADANVHVCKSVLYLESFPVFLLLSSAEFEIGCLGNGCHLTHLMNSKDGHYCAEKHFLNVFLMEIVYFLKCFINNWSNSKNWKMNELVAFSYYPRYSTCFSMVFLLPVNQII